MTQEEEQWFASNRLLSADFKDLITYKVVNMYPFEVEECTIGTGAACGAIYLDRQFENLIRGRFESVGINLDDRRLADIVRHFDGTIKCQFNPFDPVVDNDFEISVGMPDMPLIGLRDNYLTLTR